LSGKSESGRLRKGRRIRRTPSYAGRSPASAAASRVGRGNTKVGTRPERLLRAALRRLGLNFRYQAGQLLGAPDILFPQEQIAVFCDGDFWHGRRWPERKVKLMRGTNAAYWVAKIARNRARDRSIGRVLRALGWRVIRVWETDVCRNPDRVARAIARRTGLTYSNVKPRQGIREAKSSRVHPKTDLRSRAVRRG